MAEGLGVGAEPGGGSSIAMFERDGSKLRNHKMDYSGLFRRCWLRDVGIQATQVNGFLVPLF